jgi:hypothetical protein
MQVRTAILFIVVAVIGYGCTKNPEDKIIGEWKGDSGGTTASFVFNRDRTVRMIVGNVVVDGPTIGGKVEWRLDPTRDPMSLDVVRTNQTQGENILRMIIRFITDQKLQLRMSPDTKSCPVSFSAEDTENQLVLTKQ